MAELGSSPYINHFIQPDSIIPNPADPQSWNRYAYTLNNPVRYNDPTGHCAGPVMIVCFIVGIVLVTSAMHALETDLVDMNAAAQSPNFSYEQQSLQQWQDNCMGQCHYAHSANPVGMTGPRPYTPLTDQYSSAMGGVVQDLEQLTGGFSLLKSLAPPARLSNRDARMWYLEQESEIPNLIDSDLPLKNQAEWAFDYRNHIRTMARDLMAERNMAIKLKLNEPNFTWDELLQHKMNKGLSGDDIYLDIIESSQKSRTSINKKLGIESP